MGHTIVASYRQMMLVKVEVIRVGLPARIGEARRSNERISSGARVQ